MTRVAPTARRAAALSAIAAATLTLAFVAGGDRATAAAPQPSSNATLTDDGACAFTVVATWKGLQVDHVFARFFIDGPNFVATMEAPATGPNAGTLKGRVATFKTGAFQTSPTAHGWYALVDLYSKAGANLGQLQTTTDTVNCGTPTFP